MVPHLVRAEGAYKGLQTCAFHHTHSRTHEQTRRPTHLHARRHPSHVHACMDRQEHTNAWTHTQTHWHAGRHFSHMHTCTDTDSKNTLTNTHTNTFACTQESLLCAHRHTCLGMDTQEHTLTNAVINTHTDTFTCTQASLSCPHRHTYTRTQTCKEHTQTHNLHTCIYVSLSHANTVRHTHTHTHTHKQTNARTHARTHRTHIRTHARTNTYASARARISEHWDQIKVLLKRERFWRKSWKSRDSMKDRNGELVPASWSLKEKGRWRQKLMTALLLSVHRNWWRLCCLVGFALLLCLFVCLTVFLCVLVCLLLLIFGGQVQFSANQNKP